LVAFYSLWLLYGFTEGLGKAYVSLVGNKTQIITSLGIYQMATGICNFFASLIGGLFGTYINPSVSFIFGSFMALIAIFLFIILSKIIKPEISK